MISQCGSLRLMRMVRLGGKVMECLVLQMYTDKSVLMHSTLFSTDCLSEV